MVPHFGSSFNEHTRWYSFSPVEIRTHARFLTGNLEHENVKISVNPLINKIRQMIALKWYINSELQNYKNLKQLEINIKLDVTYIKINIKINTKITLVHTTLRSVTQDLS